MSHLREMLSFKMWGASIITQIPKEGKISDATGVKILYVTKSH
jgi:hypothetical protein